MRALFLTPFPIEGPSSRMRVWQYLPALRELGVEATALPFLPSEFFRLYYQRGPSFRKVSRLAAFQLRRLRDIGAARRFDVVFVQREAAIFGPPLYEWLLTHALKKPLVFDFDDAIQHVSPKYGRLGPIVRFFKAPQKTLDILGWSRAVVAGNRHLENLARQRCADVTLIPTVVDHTRVFPAPKRENGPLILGWMGTHSSRPYIENLLPVLREVAARHKIVVRVIGAGKPLVCDGLPLENLEWSLDRELADLQGFDIGLYPLPDDAWAQGKSGFKAVQNMAVGVPTIASPVGATQDVLEEGKSGFFARNEAEWAARLELLLEAEALRREMGRAGRLRVEEWFCVEKQAPRLKEVLERAAT